MKGKQSKAGVSKRLVLEWSEAARHGDVDGAKRLLDAGCEIDVVDEIGMTALMKAGAFGNVDMVDWLVAAGCDIEARSVTGTTALMHAASWGQSGCLERLLAAGCRVDAGDSDGETSLMFAVRGASNAADARGHKACMALLFKAGCDLDAVDVEGCSAWGVARDRRFDWAMGMIDAERERRELAKAAGVGAESSGANARGPRV